MPTRPDNDIITDAPRRRRQRKPSPLAYLLPAAIVLFLLALAALALTRCGARQANVGDAPTAPPAATVTPTPTTPTPTPTSSEVIPVPTPTPTPVAVYDFTQSAPEREAVGDDYFTDAVFIGDSRTDGLKLFGGIPETSFLDYTGITVFEVADTKKGVRIDGQKYSILQALELKQYKKVYIMLGVNELGYFNDEGFQNEYAGFVDKVRALQPDAVIYLQNLPAINPDKAKANDQPYYITNEQIAVYNEIIAGIAADKHTVLVDVDAALTDENGVLLRENTTDGVHFSKDHYKKWYEYLKRHTVDSDQYWAGQ